MKHKMLLIELRILQLTVWVAAVLKLCVKETKDLSLQNKISEITSLYYRITYPEENRQKI